MNDQNDEIDLIELTKYLWKHKLPIAVVTILCGAAGAAWTFSRPAVYTSDSLVLIRTPVVRTGLGGLDVDSWQGHEKLESDAVIAGSRSVVDPVQQAFEKEGTAYHGSVTAEVVKKTQLIRLHVTGATADEAKKANGLVLDSFGKRLAAFRDDNMKKGTASIKSQLATASPEERASAEKQLSDLNYEKDLMSDEMVVVDAPSQGSAPGWKQKAKWPVLGLVLGFVLSAFGVACKGIFTKEI